LWDDVPELIRERGRLVDTPKFGRAVDRKDADVARGRTKGNADARTNAMVCMKKNDGRNGMGPL